mmetsp:Transcript_6187/g.9731  ORF Transcript_6187/g.9731 Transcript_6187/m.9731 type:complete len:1302 (+) Transcript_6187:185-4090(+)|eukprot:CAMPEP_0203770296 /NCGR_PEP_ID=MMETSP0099_2-20121227/2719_1 /ASSEMBLY_ACC=CAM_ASM_000209 /TAXON_ID=96639 /ORGANISM=" , Strain NY0313808BC1" /LENGTH=1301 /DNA_ID=CAMNT_0050667391 /DNA_START=124 /DNA_END=4029 /DNA_ORIENTATION=+
MDRASSFNSLHEIGNFAHSLFEDASRSIATQEFIDILKRTGLSLDDERITQDVHQVLLKHPVRLTIKEVLEVTRKNSLIELALSGGLVINDFEKLTGELNTAFEEAKKDLENDKNGDICRRTPKLAMADPNKLAASFCSINGQCWNRGDVDDLFTVQEICGPILYCVALELNGVEKVHKHIGREPSGRGVRELCLDSNNLPFNPFVDSGLVMCSTLIKPELAYSERFDYIKKMWKKATGTKDAIGFANSHYLAQRKHANQAYCLAYMMKEHNSFPEGADSDMTKMLEFFFMNCSIEVSCAHLSSFAACLAGGGVCPTTNARVFSAEHVQNCLSMMSSCGMNDYSGSLQFVIGFPCKSSTSGFTIVVVPNLGGLCTYSPIIDTFDNSTFGMTLSKNIVSRFGLHTFDSFVVQDSSVYRQLLDNGNTIGFSENTRAIETDHDELFYCVAVGDVNHLRCLYARGIDVTVPDYDLRTALHIAASNGHVKCVHLLVLMGAFIDGKDRLGNTPLDDARLEGHEEIVSFLTNPPSYALRESESCPNPTVTVLNSLADGTSDDFRKKSKPRLSLDSTTFHLGMDTDEEDEESSATPPLASPVLEPEGTMIRRTSTDTLHGDDNNELAHQRTDSTQHEEGCDERTGAMSCPETSHYGPSSSAVKPCRGSLLRGLHAYRIIVELSQAADAGTAGFSITPPITPPPTPSGEGPLASLSDVFTGNRPASLSDVFSGIKPGHDGFLRFGEERVAKWLTSLEEIVMVSGTDGETLRHPPTEYDLVLALQNGGVQTLGSSNPLAKEFDFLNCPQRSVFVRASKLIDFSNSPKSENSANGENACGPKMKFSENLTAERLDELATKYPYIPKVLEGRCAIGNFQGFCEEMKELYDVAKQDRGGGVATYIPQLALADPEKFGVAVCSVDAQRFIHGDARERFCLQSCMKAISYCIAVEQAGSEEVHKHVGYEPSGRNFNELTLNKYGLPHNPLINAGAIVTSSCIMPDSSPADRFDFVTSVWTKLTGGVKPGYSNATFLSEKATADRNYCLGYLMKEEGAFPDHVDSSEKLDEVLEFYFQMCSLELDCESLSIVAATLANGGVNPITQERVFSSETVRDCLSIMSSSGMYDFSGEFQFSIGFPCKSGVAGALLIVIPNVMGICTWCPRLDKLGNSQRGIMFCKLLKDRFCVHRYSLLRGVSKKFDVRDYVKSDYEQRRTQKIIYAATRGDVKELHLCLSENIDVNCKDYDGRTPMHLASSENHLRVVRLLHEAGAYLNPVDRWGHTPLADAMRMNHVNVVEYLTKHGGTKGLEERIGIP